MRHAMFFLALFGAACLSSPISAQNPRTELRNALTLHASFDSILDADFSAGDRRCYYKKGKELLPATTNEELQIDASGGKFGNGLVFTKKGNTRPIFLNDRVLQFDKKDWNLTVSCWLKLSPDLDLEPGYCDPIQIVGDDLKKGFIFLEWSKNETPRYFRFAIRPLFPIWNPKNIQWDEIPFDQRPMVQLQNAPFHRDAWTHVVFVLDHVNQGKTATGKLYMNGELRGEIKNWDLSIDWDPSQVQLVLGASYVGKMDELSVFKKALSPEEIRELYQLPQGIQSLRNP